MDHEFARHHGDGVALARKPKVKRLHRAPGLARVNAPRQKNLVLGQRLAVELERWFPAHIEALDQALTQWLFKCATGGGNAVVFRR